MSARRRARRCTIERHLQVAAIRSLWDRRGQASTPRCTACAIALAAEHLLAPQSLFTLVCLPFRISLAPRVFDCLVAHTVYLAHTDQQLAHSCPNHAVDLAEAQALREMLSLEIRTKVTIILQESRYATVCRRVYGSRQMRQRQCQYRRRGKDDEHSCRRVLRNAQPGGCSKCDAILQAEM